MERSLPVPLVLLARLDNNQYLAKITIDGALPNRGQICAWARKNGLAIDPQRIHIRGDVLRIVATSGEATFKPGAGYMKAMQDTRPECLLAERGDDVHYVHAGLRSEGVLRDFTNDGRAIIANTITSALDEVLLGDIIEVSGIKVLQAAAVNPEELLAAQLGM